MRASLILLVAGIAILASVQLKGDDSELYYAAETPFRSGIWEVRLNGGYDFSNPYLHVLSGGATAFWRVSAAFALGVEGAKYTSSYRDGTARLAKDLKDYGYAMDAVRPDWSSAAVLRITPLSGLVNFFSSRIVAADISFLVRAGGIAFKELPMAPFFGAGMEVSVGVIPNLGIYTSLVCDADKPQGRPWETRVGFQIGPTVSF